MMASSCLLRFDAYLLGTHVGVGPQYGVFCLGQRKTSGYGVRRVPGPK